MQEQNASRSKKSVQNTEEEFYADTLELETKKRAAKMLNQDEGIFTHAFLGGLNMEEGIFDKTALFKTK